ncbi:MAG: hypothetical protein IPP27_01975 [Bacteroidetes bacterium]|nr:hypothetical protein [Bacteroidota bacterium]MBK8365067.1 hypothetical protein [Bacteroidota bacterium]MBK9414429.1 hypothetical protein [Bacteroidota bacterium]MBL0030987.1 hypothetical protein [Bacteroidota bacterium]
MTKFESICDSYSGAREEFKKYRSECHQFAGDLWKGIVDHFQIPYSQLSFFKLNEEGEYESVPAPIFNTLSIRADSFWEFAFGINVYEGKDVFPQETIILGLIFKKLKDRNYLVKLIDYEEEFEIDESNLPDHQKFYEYLFGKITESYTIGLQTFLDQDVTQRTIGFRLGQNK